MPLAHTLPSRLPCCYCCSITKSCLTLCNPVSAAHQASLSFIISSSLPKCRPIESVMPSNHLILCRPLLLPPSVFPSIRAFSHESALSIRWPKHWIFSISISPSNEYSGLFPFRMDWFNLPTVHGTLKSLLQHYNPKASVLWCSLFFMVQPSHPYVTTGKATALTRRTFDCTNLLCLHRQRPFKSAHYQYLEWWPKSLPQMENRESLVVGAGELLRAERSPSGLRNWNSWWV